MLFDDISFFRVRVMLVSRKKETKDKQGERERDKERVNFIIKFSHANIY